MLFCSFSCQESLPKRRGDSSVRIGPPLELSSLKYWAETKNQSLSWMNGPPICAVVSMNDSLVGFKPSNSSPLKLSDRLLFE